MSQSEKNVKFSGKLFDTAVTLKYKQGHWKWYEWVQLREYYYHTKFDIYHIYSVWVNRNINIFATYGQLASQLASQILIITYSHFSCESIMALKTIISMFEEKE